MTAQQSSYSGDTVDGMSCSAFAHGTETQIPRNADGQSSRNKLVYPNSTRCTDDGGAVCSEQEHSETIRMHSNEKIVDNTDGDGRNNNENKFNESTTNRPTNKNCDNSNEYETSERRYGGASAAVAASGGGGGISSDSGVGVDLGLDDDDTDEDPYAELEFYLEKVKVSIIVTKSLISGAVTYIANILTFPDVGHFAGFTI